MTLYPKSILTKIIIISVISILVIQVMIITLFIHDRREYFQNNDIEYTLNKIINLSKVLHIVSSDYYESALSTFNHPGIFLSLSDTPLYDTVHTRNTKIEKFINSSLKYKYSNPLFFSSEKTDLKNEEYEYFISNKEKEIKESHVPKNITKTDIYNFLKQNNINHLSNKQTNKNIYNGCIKITHNKYLIFSYSRHKALIPTLSNKMIYTILFITLIGTIIFSAFILQIIKPLEKLSKQANNFSKDYNLPLLEEKGPTEILTLIKSFNRMQKKINSFIIDRTRILASISHDLKTPLTTLKLRTDFLPESEDKEKMLKTIDSMTEMLKATTIFAKGDTEIESIQKVNIIELLNEICKTYIERDKKLSFKLNTISDKLYNYECKKTEFCRIIQNILDNAFQYGTIVNLSLTEENDKFAITITDNGPGIPKEQLGQVFKPFFRLDKARNTQNSNVGLGLSIVKSFLIKQGGDIKLSNIEPHGLRVEIVFFIKG